ncbi:hypothetical protein Y032_0043g782 [Ancylostoma ceylanicum]|uniref:Glycosyltransferase family 92 protein n=2 Tax=Ancylostoma ceylanicum TaxID=53326 RepID=A0A016UFE3_9BILA|nr:hypothetical protein Y032_0043g782 [Ancylostoma ceylanicum]
MCLLARKDNESNMSEQLSVEPLSLSKPHKDVVCLGYALLYEDRGTFQALLDYYSQRSDLMVLYVGSMSDEVYEETAPFKEKLEIIPWPIFPRKTKASPDTLRLNARLHRSSQAAAFTDCWLRFAPISQRITMSDLAAIRFPTARIDKTTGDSIFKHLFPSWAITQLLIHRIIHNECELSSSISPFSTIVLVSLRG